MSPEPLISVMMPCFNAARTLPMALASLQAQTYSNWEALIVDDGSTDATWDILNARPDPRIKLERFSQNRGRGAARQCCLEMLRGEFLAPLDSDDWQYPERLQSQVQWLLAEPKLAMVSAAYVLTDEENHVIGMASSGLRNGEHTTVAQLQRIMAPPLAFPCSMIRMADAKNARFNPRFLRSQDSDFVMQFLLGRYYGVSRQVNYSYFFNWPDALANTLAGYRYRLQTYAQYFSEHPMQVATECARTLGKMATYRAARLVGQERRLIERRWQPPSDAIIADHKRAAAAVEAYL